MAMVEQRLEASALARNDPPLNWNRSLPPKPEAPELTVARWESLAAAAARITAVSSSWSACSLLFFLLHSHTSDGCLPQTKRFRPASTVFKSVTRQLPPSRVSSMKNRGSYSMRARSPLTSMLGRSSARRQLDPLRQLRLWRLPLFRRQNRSRAEKLRCSAANKGGRSAVERRRRHRTQVRIGQHQLLPNVCDTDER